MSVPVHDSFNATADAKMPSLRDALDPATAQRELAKALKKSLCACDRLEVCRIRVLRHKPGRRALIEYEVQSDALPGGRLTLLGKVRAKGTDTATHDLLFTLRAHGFDERSVDGVGVPRPLGVVPKFRMWLQQKTSGISSAELLPSGDGVALARRIAEAAHKIHVLNLAPRREHTMAGELRILHERLGLLAQQRREWKTRLERVLEGCERIAAGVPTTEPRPIHRDFYPAQVLVDGGRLWLLDFDLFCLGDPAVDVGNFVGHITEQSVRSTGNPRALAEVEAALAERFVELSGPASRAAVEVCTTLTLVRHVHISTLFPERQPFTERLLEYCEERLSGSQT